MPPSLPPAVGPRRSESPHIGGKRTPQETGRTPHPCRVRCHCTCPPSTSTTRTIPHAQEGVNQKNGEAARIFSPSQQPHVARLHTTCESIEFLAGVGDEERKSGDCPVLPAAPWLHPLTHGPALTREQVPNSGVCSACLHRPALLARFARQCPPESKAPHEVGREGPGGPLTRLRYSAVPATHRQASRHRCLPLSSTMHAY